MNRLRSIELNDNGTARMRFEKLVDGRVIGRHQVTVRTANLEETLREAKVEVPWHRVKS